MQLSDFYFDLPESAIAKFPLAERSQSRLLAIKPDCPNRDLLFKDIVQFVNAGDLLVFNDTRVIPARLFGQKSTGGRVELLVERILGQKKILAQLHVSKSPQAGQTLFFAENIQLEVLAKAGRFYELLYLGPGSILEAIELIGTIPLPPYMRRDAEKSDLERYQTVYATEKGSVAAPTAGLHFDTKLLNSLQEKKVAFGKLTLHIGAGTFLPVREQDITQHQMHSEYFQISETLCQQIKATKARGQKVIAVGTTSLRALETVAARGSLEAFTGETQLFIYPGYRFQCVDALITNFHLPQSSLLMLVCALGGYERIMRTYQEAVRAGYRFYSYGDAMWVEKNDATHIF